MLRRDINLTEEKVYFAKETDLRHFSAAIFAALVLPPPGF